ncbi:MAG: hypothetical protein NDI82_06270 [Anaeromyxobacteraceae bacterium]|nr:hypothetical protein [Anaeromyxobacteraceae bacterium]
MQLTHQEVMVLVNALNEALNGPDAIEAWEFPVRMGVEPSEAEQLLVKLNALVEATKGPTS